MLLIGVAALGYLQVNTGNYAQGLIIFNNLLEVIIVHIYPTVHAAAAHAKLLVDRGDNRAARKPVPRLNLWAQQCRPAATKRR
jgi:hypothetical protein